MIPGVASLFRFYVNASDRWKGEPRYQAVVSSARAMGIAGASVFPVELSFGAHRRLRDASSDYQSFEIPVVIELVDEPGRIEALLAGLGPLLAEGLATVEPVGLIRCAHPDDAPRVGSEPSGRLTPMAIAGSAQRLTVYIGSSDTWHGRNLALAIVERCRSLGIAGATASRGIMGFGKNSRLHRAHLLGLSEDLPERIEIVDRPDRIAQLLPILDEMVTGGLVILEDVRVVHDPPSPTNPGA
jgi:PII-like signaling protein